MTLADKESEAIILEALRRLAPEIPVVSEEAAGGEPRLLWQPLLPGRSAGRHQGIHQEAERLHREYRADRAWAPELRAGLCAGAVAARVDGRERRGDRGRASAERWRRRSGQASTAGARGARRRPARPDGAGQPLPSRPRDRGLPRQAQDRQALGRRLVLEVPRDRSRRGRRLSALRPDHGVGHCRWPGRARGVGRQGGHADGDPLRYGKTEAGLRNPSFIAWGR